MIIAAIILVLALFPLAALLGKAIKRTRIEQFGYDPDDEQPTERNPDENFETMDRFGANAGSRADYSTMAGG